jgi:hypothetical protein
VGRQAIKGVSGKDLMGEELEACVRLPYFQPAYRSPWPSRGRYEFTRLWWHDLVSFNTCEQVEDYISLLPLRGPGDIARWGLISKAFAGLERTMKGSPVVAIGVGRGEVGTKPRWRRRPDPHSDSIQAKGRPVRSLRASDVAAPSPSLRPP